MDALTLARWQFGITTIYHFFFVPLTLGLSLLVAIMETAYVRTGNEQFKRMTQFWGRLFLINFAMGVVTGLVQEFQFGMNWSSYSRFVGDIFGAPLAIEALLAFFIESTFLGIWIFGWDKLSKRTHLFMIWLVVLGSNLSAFWILVANSFMQEPVGYTLRNGRAEMTNFFALLTNPNVWVQFPHVLMSGIATASFFVLGISAYHLLHKKGDLDLFRRSLNIGLIAAVISSFLVSIVGHTQAQHMVQVEPMKMAAAEALWNSEQPASFSLFTIGNEKDRKDVFAIRIPDVLSILSFNSVDGQVQGINNLQAQYVKQYGPGDYVPPVWVVYWSFRLMVGAGTVMILLSLTTLFLVLRKRLEKVRWFLWLLPFAIALPYLANSAGWIMTEVGRQPWIVFGLLTTTKGVSPTVGTATVLISLIVFTLLYGGLMVADIFLLVRSAKGDGIVEPEEDSEIDMPLVGAY
ncbi:MAG: cytochrome ubiquinol oxidase subunit I [Ktedonobacteraceae bacterium]|nr:cytochrome ubiquinol oxidase subunit I [Ktedonobacteraceae bacterium]